MTPSKQAPTYLSRITGGKYEISYQAKAGNPKGVPVPEGSDLITLSKVGGSTNAPMVILASEYDLNTNFTLVVPVDPSDPGTKATAPSKK